MMRLAIWVLLGWLGMTFWTGLAARLSPGWVFPDAPIIIVCFVALRQKPVPAALLAVALGYLAGRQGGAPVGLHETALLGCAVAVYLSSGRLAGSGALFFAPVCGVTLAGYHLLLALLLTVGGQEIGFSSWATAVLLPNVLITALVGLLSYGPLAWLESRLADKPREGLQWR